MKTLRCKTAGYYDSIDEKSVLLHAGDELSVSCFQPEAPCRSKIGHGLWCRARSGVLVFIETENWEPIL